MKMQMKRGARWKNSLVSLLLVLLALSGCKKSEQPPTYSSVGQVINIGPAADDYPEMTKLGAHVDKGTPHENKPILRVEFFSDKSIKDADLAKLKPLLDKVQMPVLLHINEQHEITNAGIADLKGTKSIEVLWIGKAKKLTPACLTHLQGFPNLKDLSYSNDALIDDDLAPIEKLTKLERCRIYGKKLTENGYVHVKPLNSLKEVKCGDKLGDTGLAHIKGLQNLVELHLESKALSDVGMVNLKGMRRLRKLWCEGRDCEKLTDAGIANLAGLAELRELDLLSIRNLTDAGLTALKGLKNLEKLSILDCRRVNDAGIANIQGLTNLKHLHYNHFVYGDGSVAGEFTDGSLVFLKGLTNLQDLDIGSMKVSGDGLKHLAGLKKLKELHLSFAAFKDAGLASLGKISSLERLSLDRSNITDAGLVHLEGMKSLGFLDLYDAKVTLAGINKLKKALPNLHVNSALVDK